MGRDGDGREYHGVQVVYHSQRKLIKSSIDGSLRPTGVIDGLEIFYREPRPWIMPDHSPKKSYRVGVLVFEGVNTLDFTGPMEVLSHVPQGNVEERGRVFNIKTIAQRGSTTTANSLRVEADMILADALEQMHGFDVLVVPGAPLPTMQKMIESRAPEIDLIHAFASSGATRSKILFSICTGAFLLGAAGVLSRMTVTTHHRALDALRDSCRRARTHEAPAQIVHRRFVDGGLWTGTKTQVITAGGISSGIDATFYIVCRLTSAETASCISQVMEYGWKEPRESVWPARFQKFQGVFYPRDHRRVVL